MAEALEAMGFPSEWCETALKSSSGLETAVDLLLQWQMNGIPQQFVPSTLSSAPGSSSRGKKPIFQHEQTNTSSLPAGGAPTLKLEPLPGSVSNTSTNDESEGSLSSILLPPSSGHSSLERLSRVKHHSSSESSGDTNPSDAVVPDALVEQRKARYLAASREKQEKEATRERIRQQMREDMAIRRSRHHYESPATIDKGKSKVAHEGEVDGVETLSGPVSMNSDVELHIRCPWNQNLKGSFRAGDKLTDVRAYVEQQSERRPYWVDIQEHRNGHLREDHFRVRSEALPFSGRSACISDSASSQSLEEIELLKAARENFEIRTRQIVASAKSLRKDTSEQSQPCNETTARIYFVIPFPKKEFLTESAMESTLAEAQLVPTGTLVVQYGVSGEDQRGESLRRGENCEIPGNAKNPRARTVGERVPRPALVTSGDRSESPHAEHSEDGFHHLPSAAREGGRTLETEGERVRIREQALQAAAKRMSEAANIFRAGVPLEAGETGQAFHFPQGEENQNVEIEGRKDDIPSVSSSVARPAVQKDASVRRGSVPNNADAAGVDADLPNSPNKRAESCRYPASRTLDPPHLMAVAAAEERLRNPRPIKVVEECSQNYKPSEKETTSQGEISRLQLRGRGRMSGTSELRPRPEKQQRTSNRFLPGTLVSQGHLRSTVQHFNEGSSSQRQSRSPGDAERRAESLKAALQRCKEAAEGDNKGKGLVEDAVLEEMTPSSSSPPVELERSSTLRVRLEDGSVVSRTFAANTQLQLVRNSVTPDGAAFSDYGFVVPCPDPRFMEGDDLGATLEDVGLVPRGTIHLRKVSTRGTVREGRTLSHRRQEHDYDDYFRDDLFQRWDRVPNEDFTYEDMMQLEESIGRVHVGVPEEIVTLFPTRILEEELQPSAMDEEEESDLRSKLKGELDLCTVCMAEMVPQEEIMSLPCIHTYHSLCIRKWLRQSTHCPTCKRSVV